MLVCGSELIGCVSRPRELVPRIPEMIHSARAVPVLVTPGIGSKGLLQKEQTEPLMAFDGSARARVVQPAEGGWNEPGEAQL